MIRMSEGNESFSADARWDLHCHTQFSDGTHTPTELVRQAKESGLQGVAITDHDTYAGWDEVAQASRRYRFPVIRGSEITAYDRRTSVHMLAYLYDPNNETVIDMFATTRQARLKRTRSMVESMAQDYPISWEAVLAQVGEGDRTTVGRPHIADALVHAGVYGNRSQAFAGICSSDSPYYIPTPSPSTHEVIRCVHAAGGVVVIAHAGAVARNPELLSDEQIETLISEGLDGLEIWHRDNSSEQRERLSQIAVKHGLIMTGGSDWHGKGKPNRLGENVASGTVASEIVNRGCIPLLP
ncbi:MAG: PHP domain-containing protein [Bifidobacterium sp.]